MGCILGFVALQGDSIKRSTFETLTRCRTLAEESGRSFEAAVLAPPGLGVTDQIAAYGPSRIHVIEHEVFGRHQTEPAIAGMQAAIEAASPDVFVMPSTEGVKDVLGALSVKTGMTALPDASSFSIQGDHVEGARPVMAAKFVARVRAALPTIVTVRSGSYAAEEGEARQPEVNRIDFSFDTGSVRAELRDVAESIAGQVDLTDARVVVAAGRGVRDEEGKRLVEELAGIFDAAIGSSRAVVENGLFEATTQVGQTGKVVSPDLYFAVGISGAIQHAAGMQNSRVIVAINKDPDAPIFDYATYGVVGDLFKVLPPLIEELRKAKS